jgi:hypothetical protein
MMAQVPLYVVGGRQRQNRGLGELGHGWYGYGTGVILRIDPDGGVSTEMEFTSPPDACVEGDPILFKCASRCGDRLYCCTQTEVVVFSLPDFQQLAYVSLPQFNDVHHVLPTAHGTILAAVSGLEMVVEIDEAGNVLGEWNVLGEDPWDGFDRELDYRQGINTKPHRAHPNHLFQLDGRPWVTRFECKDAVAVGAPSDRILAGHERVHDGVVRNDGVYFTTVDGCVVRCDPAVGSPVETQALAPSRGSDEVLGWCRGLYFEDDAHCWVGFSRVRPTRLRETVAWIRNRGTSQAPTRIARYATDGWTLLHEIDLEPHGMHAVFSIVPADRHLNPGGREL